MAIIVTPENREDIARALAALANSATGNKKGSGKQAAQASKPATQANGQGAK